MYRLVFPALLVYPDRVPRNLFFIVNPMSANGHTGRFWPRMRELLQARLGAIKASLTRGTLHAAELAREALERGFEKIVAVGGDGTLNEVLNGFLRSKTAGQASLSYLPSGTGGDFARTLGTYNQPLEDRILRLNQGPVRRLDCGKAVFRKEDGETAERYFMNESSVGFSADTVSAVNQTSKHFGGKLCFLLGVLRCLATLKKPLLEIAVDGRTIFSGPALMAAVANGRFFGGNMMIAPEAKVDDGLLDVVAVSAVNRRAVLGKIGKIYRGEHLSLPEVVAGRGRTVSVSSPQQRVLLEMDGEQPGILEARFEICASAVPFIY